MKSTACSRPCSFLVAACLSASLGGCFMGGPDDRVADGSVGDVGVQLPPDAGFLAPCSERLEGAAPFGRPMQGSATFTLEGTGKTAQESISMQVYFPAGRVAGAPVVFAVDAWPTGIVTASSVLGADKGAEVAVAGSDGRDLGIKGTLVGPDDGVRASVYRNFADAYTDIAKPGGAEMQLCPQGELPAPTFGTSHGFAPDSFIKLTSTSPIDVPSVQVSAKRSDGSAVEVDVEATSTSITVSPRAGVFPPGELIHLELDDTRDVIGRVFPRAVRMVPAAEQPVPEPGTSASLQGGQSVDRVDAVFALGGREASTAARMNVSWEFNCSGVRLTVVSADGKSTRATIAADARGFDGSVPLPGAGKQWLSVYARQWPMRPQWGYVPPCRIEIAAVGLE